MTNQNFRVKKGLEVGLGGTFLYVDSTGVGINSTAPRESLDVPGTSVFGVSTSTAAFESIGIASFRSNVIIDGNLELLGDLFFDEFEARNGNITGVITTKDFRSTGIATFNDVVIEGNLTVDGSGGGGGTEITENSIETEFLNVTGVTTTAELVVSGISTFIGTVTTDDLFVQGTISADVGSFEFTELTGENLLYSGIATISQKVISNVGVFTSLDVEYADFDDINVSGAATVGVLTVADKITTNDLFVEGTITADVGSFEFTELTGTNLFYSGVGTIAQRIESNSGIFTSLDVEYADFDGINVAGVATVGFLTVTNNVTIGGTVDFEGDVNVDFDINVTRNVNITGILSATEANFEILTFDDAVGTSLTVKKLNVEENAQILDATIGIATIGFSSIGIATVGVATIGVLTATEAVIGDLLITGNLTGSSGDAIIIDGDTNITGVVTIGSNSITLDGRAGREYIEIGTGSGDRISGFNTFTGERSFVSVDEGRFNNFINVAGVGSTSTFAGDVNVAKRLTADSIGFNTGNGTELTIDTLNVTTINSGGGSGGISGDDLFITGIATVGELVVTGVSSFAGLATFQEAFIKDLTVDTITTGGGVLSLEALETDNLSVTGVSTFVGLATFGRTNTQEAVIKDLLLTQGRVLGVLTAANVDGVYGDFESLNVVGFATIGTGATIGGSLNVRDNISVGSSVTAEDFYGNFIGSLGGDVTNLPPASIVSDTAPTQRISGEALVSGDLWFDSLRIRQYTYYVDVDSSQWVDSNPQITIPTFKFTGDTGSSQLNLVDDQFNINGFINEIETAAGVGSTVTVRLAPDVVIRRDLSVAGFATVGTGMTVGGDTFINGDLFISGITTVGGGISLTGDINVDAGQLDIDSIKTRTLLVEDVLFADTDEDNVIVSVGASIVGILTAKSQVWFENDLKVVGVITAQDINTTSDKRVKENIRPIENALEKITKLNGVEFNFVNSGKPSAGVIAQEVERVFPQLIAGTFPKSVNYNGLIGALIESVKELKEQNELMLQEIEELKKNK